MGLMHASHSNFLADIGTDGHMNTTKLKYTGLNVLHYNEAFANLLCVCV